jgi:CBS domain-containing protein
MINQRIRDVLAHKGGRVHSVGPLATVSEAVAIMNDHRVGSVLVIEDGYPVGIFSERDVLTRVVAVCRDPRSTAVNEVMTRRLHVASVDDTVLDVMKLMTQKRCRHIPVLEGERLVGLVSIGDVTKATEENLRGEVRDLSSYIAGPYLS